MRLKYSQLSILSLNVSGNNTEEVMAALKKYAKHLVYYFEMTNAA